MIIRLTLRLLGSIWIKDYGNPIQCLSLLRLHISPYLRGEICKGLENFGIEIDESKNSKIRGGQDCIISKENSKVKIMVILTDEELMIARDTLRLIK